MKNLILVVIYNKKLKDSSTINSLCSSKKVLNKSAILVWDNSIKGQTYNDMRKDFQRRGVTFMYEHHPENLPLSKVYNDVIKRTKNEGYDFLILFDHDSIFKVSFFTELKAKIMKFPTVELFLPIVKYKNKIVSPTKKYFLKGFYFKEKPQGIIRAKNISAINSGMVISFKFLKSEFKGYDERLKFYGTDDFFMIKYCEHNDNLYVLSYEFEHDLTLSTLNENSENLKKSYYQMIEAWSIMHRNKFYYPLVKLYTFVHSVYTSVKFKDSKYIKWV